MEFCSVRRLHLWHQGVDKTLSALEFRMRRFQGSSLAKFLIHGVKSSFPASDEF